MFVIYIFIKNIHLKTSHINNLLDKELNYFLTLLLLLFSIFKRLFILYLFDI